MKRCIFLVVCVLYAAISHGQNGMFMPRTYARGIEMYPDTIKKEGPVVFSPGPYIWLWPTSQRILYFWYSEKQEQALRDEETVDKSKSWFINGIKFTEIRVPNKRSEWKDGKVVYIWKDGKNDLVITRE
jgi:hypothetical protein